MVVRGSFDRSCRARLSRKRSGLAIPAARRCRIGRSRVRRRRC